MVTCLANVSAGTCWTLRRIVGFDTPTPGAGGTFWAFGNQPAIDRGVVVFEASGGGQTGIYRYQAGELTVVADRNTAVPGTDEYFYGFSRVSIDRGSIAFAGKPTAEPGMTGVYALIDGELQRVVDPTTAVPGRSESTDDLRSPCIGGQTVAFWGKGSDHKEGIYIWRPGQGVAVVADHDTPVPGITGTFSYLGDQAAVDGESVVFYGGRYQERAGIYRDTNGVGSVVCDKSTRIPGGSGNFVSFSNPSADDGMVAFRGFGDFEQTGIYAHADGGLVRIADKGTSMPGGQKFTWFHSQVAIDGGNVAFVGYGESGSSGLYARYDGVLGEIIDLDDTLEGKSLRELHIGRESLSGGRVVFRARFTDDSESLYIATIPEPATVAFLALGGLAVLRRR